MKKFILLILAFSLILIACKKAPKKTQNAEKHKLVFVAETVDSLTTSESVLYYKDKDLLFVSCINGQPLEKNGKGFISQIDKNGNIIKLHWINNLNAPKGMGIYDNKLYVTDIDRIVIIDLNNAEIISTINVDSAKFLNDIAIDQDGNVYISDSQNNLVYMLQNDTTVNIFAQNLKGANGLYIQNDKLLVGCNDRLAAIDLATQEVTTVYQVNTLMIDGLKPTDNGYITTDWQGGIFFLDVQNDTMYSMLNFPDKNKNAADIEFIASSNLVFVPSFFDNRVIIYRFE